MGVKKRILLVLSLILGCFYMAQSQNLAVEQLDFGKKLDAGSALVFPVFSEKDAQKDLQAYSKEIRGFKMKCKGKNTLVSDGARLQEGGELGLLVSQTFQKEGKPYMGLAFKPVGESNYVGEAEMADLRRFSEGFLHYHDHRKFEAMADMKEDEIKDLDKEIKELDKKGRKLDRKLDKYEDKIVASDQSQQMTMYQNAQGMEQEVADVYNAQQPLVDEREKKRRELSRLRIEQGTREGLFQRMMY